MSYLAQRQARNPFGDKNYSSESNYLNDYSIDKLQIEFCKDYVCCGKILNDMHELIHHYEDCHVILDSDQEEEEEEEEELSPYAEQIMTIASAYMDESNPTMTVLIENHDDVDNHGENKESKTSFVNDAVSAFEDKLISRKRERDEFNEQLVRRIGDVEDDLSIRLLEMINEELEKNGKRVKLQSNQKTDPSTGVTLHGCEILDGELGKQYDVLERKSKTSPSFSDNLLIEDHTASYSSSLPLFLSSNSSDDGNNHNNNSFSGRNVDKPYRCFHPGCDKVYKNPNGLKYHNMHGHCEGEEQDLDFAARLLKPYICNFHGCYKRYKNLNGLKYHIEKSHGLSKGDSNQLATTIVKKTNSEYGINARSVSSSVLLVAMKEKEARERVVSPESPHKFSPVEESMVSSSYSSNSKFLPSSPCFKSSSSPPLSPLTPTGVNNRNFKIVPPTPAYIQALAASGFKLPFNNMAQNQAYVMNLQKMMASGSLPKPGNNNNSMLPSNSSIITNNNTINNLKSVDSITGKNVS